jgi:rod shape-determining protein MreC
MNINGQSVATERKVIVLVAVLFMNLILVSSNVVLKNEKSLFQNIIGVIISPFQSGFQKTVDYFSREMRHYVFLKENFKQYHELRKKYVRLLYKNYLLKKKIHEVEFLETLKEKQTQFIKADTISVDRNFPYTSIMIDRGSSDGIARDMIVLNRELQLVGKIVPPISPFSAKVRLVTSATGGIGAYIDKKETLEGLITGNNSPICNFKYLMENQPVQVGDTVVTSGTDQIYPPYLPIGKVTKVEKEYLTQKIEVEPFFSKQSLKQLIIISNDQQQPINTGNQ